MSIHFLSNFPDQWEDVLLSMLDQSPDCIKLIGLDGSIEYMNANGLAALAIDDFSQVAGRNWVEVWPAESASRVALALSTALTGKNDRFEGFCPTMAGEPRWWDVTLSPIRNRGGAITHVLATSRDITPQRRERAEGQAKLEQAEKAADHADVIAREMTHRFKNQLAVIGSIARLLARHSVTDGDLALRLEDKLVALAHAQDLLVTHHAQPLTAAGAVAQVISRSGQASRIALGDVPPIALDHAAVQFLVLMLGELQTNSIKYGALRDEGTITLQGSLCEGAVRLTWHEDCGHPVAPPERAGAGSQLIARLGSVGSHRAQTQWHGTGVTVDFYLRTEG